MLRVGLFIWMTLWALAGLASGPAERELGSLLRLAAERNPRVLAARQRLAQARAAEDGVAGFFDPRLQAAAGHTEAWRSIPGSTRGPGFAEADALAGRLGLDLPVRPGAYLDVGAAERYLREPGDGYDDLYQSLLGARLWVPLARDRRFAEWRAGARRAAHNVEAARAALDAVLQAVCYETHRIYIDVLLAQAELSTVDAALARVLQLQEDTEALVTMKVVPSYQLSAPRVEVALHREERDAAAQALHVLQVRLGELLGSAGAWPIQAPASRLAQWAAGTNGSNSAPVPLDVVYRRRGVYREIDGRLAMAQAERDLAAERLKPDVAITAGLTWQGESQDQAFGNRALLSDEQVGTEIAVVWSQPLGRREEHAQLRAQEAQVAALAEERRRIGLQIAAELEAARSAVVSAGMRLRRVASAVEDARAALAAEEERFHMGEGRSRHVLDAQKDLTAAVRRQNRAAAALHRARADWAFATGAPRSEAPSHGLRLGEKP